MNAWWEISVSVVYLSRKQLTGFVLNLLLEFYRKLTAECNIDSNRLNVLYMKMLSNFLIVYMKLV